MSDREKVSKFTSEMDKKYSQIEQANMPHTIAEEAFLAGWDACDQEWRERTAGLVEALKFYADKKKYFMRKSTINLQQTTAVFKVVDPSKLPTDYESETFECSARLKVDQGETARKALADLTSGESQAVNSTKEWMENPTDEHFEFHGCFTGDCPHEKASDCAKHFFEAGRKSGESPKHERVATENEIKDVIIGILKKYEQEMEGYSYFGSNPGVSCDDYQEIANESAKAIKGIGKDGR